MSELENLYRIYLDHSLVTTDTRKIKPDSIYFALKGETFDGNAFASEALEKGAAFAIIDDDQYHIEGKTITVENVLLTLQNLARFHRKKLGTKIIGITGTNGKTTTKELMFAVLSKRYQTLATEGNLNNHIGVPLTLLKLKPEHEMAIIEMGANHVGEIAMLSEIAQPDFGLITNIGKAHLKGFGSYEGVKKAKTELYQFIKKNDGVLFVNGSDPVLMQASSDIDRRIYGGSEDDAAPMILDDGRIGLSLDHGRVRLKSQLFGNYNFYNLLAAVTIGQYFKVPMNDIAEALEEYSPTNNRSQIINTGKNIIIMDAYNANPSSMEPALRSFASIAAGHKMIILGDMFELGEDAPEEHRKLVALLEELSLENALLVGREFHAVSGKFKSFLTTDECRQHLQQHPMSGFHILIKGSRGMQLEKIREDIP